MRIVVLDRAAMGDDLDFSPLGTFGEVCIHEQTDADEVAARVREAEVLIVNKVKVTECVMAAAPSLRLICEFATGYDNIDLSAARARGIAVCNVPAYSTESVTLFTVATALSLFTNLSTYRGFVASGAYSASGQPNRLTPVYHELRGKQWGIVGCGTIGGRVAEVAEALGAHVAVYQRTPSARYENMDIDRLCQTSDILSIHCPLCDSTRRLIDDRRLRLMKRDAILVNEARGAVLDEDAVARAVLEGRIAGFGCDVYGTEPFTDAHPYTAIRDFPNVILTPHAAWGAYEARLRCLSVIGSNIEAYLNGQRKNRVD